jgi:hypothetical protein
VRISRGRKIGQVQLPRFRAEAKMGCRDMKLTMPKHRLALYLCGPIWVVACVLFGTIYQLYVNDLLEQRAYVRALGSLRAVLLHLD